MNKFSQIDAIKRCLSYFNYFEYPPTASEIQRYCSVLISEEQLGKILQELVNNNQLFQNGDRFALNLYVFNSFISKNQYAQQLLYEFEELQPALIRIPTIEFIGISGSLSMNNVGQNGDIDLFIITRAGTLWTTRFMLLLVTRLLGLVGNPAARKLCINMIWEEDHLLIPHMKQSVYTAHEILQLRPMFDKNNIYAAFTKANYWIYYLFPNVQKNSHNQLVSYKPSKSSKTILFLDRMLEQFQRMWLSFKGIKVHMHGRQLWLIQRDAEHDIPIAFRK